MAQRRGPLQHPYRYPARGTPCVILVISQVVQVKTNETELLFSDERQQKETARLSAKHGSANSKNTIPN